MLRSLLWPFLTAARRGAKDRRANAPAATALVAMRDYAAADPEAEKYVAPFVATLIHRSEEEIDHIEHRQWAPCRKLVSKASDIADRARKPAAELGQDERRYQDQHGARTFPERPIGPRTKKAIFSALAAGEFGFNLQSFNRFGFVIPDSFGALFPAGWQIIAVAGTASALLPFIGHWIGYQMKRFNRDKMTRNEMITLSVSIIGVAWLIGFLTLLRADGHALAGSGLGSLFMHAAFNVVMTVAGYLLAFWYHHDDPGIEDIAIRRERNAKLLSELQRSFAKVASDHDPLLEQIKANAFKIRDNAAARAAEYLDFNLRGDAGDYPPITRVIVLDLFRPRDFDHAPLLAQTPASMTRILEDAGILPAQQASDGPQRPAPSLNGAAATDHVILNNIDPHRGPEIHDAH